MLQPYPVLSLQAKLARTEPRNVHVIDKTRPTIYTNNVDAHNKDDKMLVAYRH